ncbi:unnamed protein product [Musa textilis]
MPRLIYYSYHSALQKVLGSWIHLDPSFLGSFSPLLSLRPPLSSVTAPSTAVTAAGAFASANVAANTFSSLSYSRVARGSATKYPSPSLVAAVFVLRSDIKKGWVEPANLQSYTRFSAEVPVSSSLVSVNSSLTRIWSS